MAELKRRILNWLTAFDSLAFSTITLGRSAPNESASAAAWRLERTGHWAGKVFRPIIDRLFFFDPNHCEQSYDNLLAGKHMPPDIRKAGA